MATYDNKLVDGKGLDQLSKGLYIKLKSEIDAKPNTTVEGGKGLTVNQSGNNYTLNVVSQDDSIIVNEDNIKLNTVNVLTDTSIVKPLSANMGKKLNEDKLDKSTFNTEKITLQNSINTKLDKGEVSEAYNTAKKIEDKIVALESRPQGDYLEKGGYSGTANDLKTLIDGKAPTVHTHNKIQDIGNNNDTTFAYSKAGLNYGDFTWLAGWNGYELRSVNKGLFFPMSGGTVSGNVIVTGKLGANDITSTGNVTAYSDRRTKANVKEINNSLDKLKTLTAYEYLMIISNQESMGFFADDVEKVFPSAVISDENGVKKVSYIQLIAPIIEAIKELDKRIKKIEGVL